MKATLKIKCGRRVHSFDCKLRITEDRIWFDRIPFSKVLNAEIKAMAGWRWHGFDDPPIKKWSIKNCPRNIFQLRSMMGENVYGWFDRPIRDDIVEFDRPVKPQQVDMIRRALTYHYQILAAEQGLGKTLAGIEIMERSGVVDWWYVGPLSGLASVELEIKKWGLSGVNLTLMTYNRLVSIHSLESDIEIPGGVIFDESDNLKTGTTKRATAAQWLADSIREKHGDNGYVIELSGTPSAKHPGDLWKQCEIAWPGFLREGNFGAFEVRYGIMEEGTGVDGATFSKRSGWKEHEVAKLPSRYAGLMTVYRKQEWLTLPPKKYRTVRLEPSNKVLRVAKTLATVAPNVITALTWLRALSSGFQYVKVQQGEETCPVCGGSGEYAYPEPAPCQGCGGIGKRPKFERKSRFVSTPKDAALKEELDKCDTHGRIVVAASFQGSIDRILAICKERGWSVACVDGRGWRSYDSMGNQIDDKPLDLWEDFHGKVAFVGNPGSCRYGLTLTLAHTLVFYDNSFSAVERLQMEDRIHRMTMNDLLGANIVDLVHLPVDQLVIDTLKSNKALELLSLGVINESIGLDEEVEDEELLD